MSKNKVHLQNMSREYNALTKHAQKKKSTDYLRLKNKVHLNMFRKPSALTKYAQKQSACPRGPNALIE